MIQCAHCEVLPPGICCTPEHTELALADISPAARQRALIKSTTDALLRELPILHNLSEPGHLEHSYDPTANTHVMTARITLDRDSWYLIVTHPHLCGCDALTNELVMHG